MRPVPVPLKKSELVEQLREEIQTLKAELEQKLKAELAQSHAHDADLDEVTSHFQAQRSFAASTEWSNSRGTVGTVTVS